MCQVGLAGTETADRHAVLDYVGNHVDLRISVYEAAAGLLDGAQSRLPKRRLNAMKSWSVSCCPRNRSTR